MPATAKAEKPEYSFTAGYITEQSPIKPVPGSALDIENYVINQDGSIRRRLGIRADSLSADVTISPTPLVGDEVFNVHLWRNAGGDPSRSVVVYQVGTLLWFRDAPGLPLFGPVDLEGLKTESTTTTEQIRTSVVSFADGKGDLLVAGALIQPFYVSIVLGSNISVTSVEVRIRDFAGVDDGVAIGAQPAALTDEHEYNLANRGWTNTEYNQYFTDKSVYPSKRMVSYLGYARATDAGVQEGYGTLAWSSDKMAAEVFASATAPQGSLLIDPFDDRLGYGATGGFDISTWSFASGSPNIITINTSTAHGLTTGDVIYITNNRYEFLENPITFHNGTLDGVYTATVTDPDSFTIEFPNIALRDDFDSWTNQYKSKGYVSAPGGGATVLKPSGRRITNRPTAVAWYAGRAWYAGTADVGLSDTIMFSQLIERPGQYGQCYQRNDPTAENFNALLPTDGGTIKVPGLYGVVHMAPFGGSLLVFGASGIWEISGGQSGFAASSYVVRKVTDAECFAPKGVCRTDFGLAAATKRGLMVLGYDTNSGYISGQDVSTSKIGTYWSALSGVALASAQLVYDDANKRIYTLLSKSTTHTAAIPYTVTGIEYTEALVLDMRLAEGGSFYKLTTPLAVTGVAGYIAGAYVVNDPTAKIKFLYVEFDGTLGYTCEMNSALYTDINSGEHVPFMTAAYDNSEDFHTRKYVAHYAFVFCGPNALGNHGATIQARWDWTNNSSTGKWSTPQQLYRAVDVGLGHGTDAVLVTRNKLRGCGRALSMHVTGAAGKDSHIMGWLIQYGAG
jgi:hypothetical protein